LLSWRLILGPTLIALLAVFCWLDAHAATPLTWLLPLAIVVSLAATSELLGMLVGDPSGPPSMLTGTRAGPPAALMYVGNAAIVASNAGPLVWPDAAGHSDLARLAWPFLAFVAMVLTAFLVEMRRYERPGGVTVNLALAAFAFAFVGLLLSFLVQLRAIEPNTFGMTALLALLVVVKMGDIGAYTVGRLFGRHKLAPTLSPGKTIEGAAGGLLLACVGSYLVLGWYWPHAPWQWITFGIVVGISGMLGDLSESLIKRDLGHKDSSHWVPGYGGVLDLLDSPLFAAPVAYACYLVGVIGP